MVGHPVDGARSLFPPGFPILLAGAGLLGLELFVMPFFGAVSGIALFHLARKTSGDAIAYGAMIAWYAAPLTFWGSTQIMSDLVAASIVLLGALCIERGRPIVAGLLLGFALGVRPTCLLAFPALAMLLAARPRKEWLRWGGALALTIFAWAVFVRISQGSLAWAYAGNLSELGGQSFAEQLAFLSKETLRQYAPMVVLSAIALVRAPRKTCVFAVWFLPFLVVHATWRVPYVWWWQLRFLASALPALFLAGAVGAAAIADVAKRTSPRSRRVLGTIAILGLVAYAASWLRSDETDALRTRDRDERYALDARRILELVPRDALIGAREHTIALRFYGKLQTFRWCHDDVPALERAAFAQGRSVYAIFMFDDDNGCPEQSAANRAGLRAEDVTVLPSKSRLVRLSVPGP